MSVTFLGGIRRYLGQLWGGGNRSLPGGFQAYGSHSDRTVSDDTAMQISTAYACGRLIAETIGTLAFSMARIDEGNVRKEAPDHHLHGLISLAPNADQSAVEFWETVALQLAFKGNFFALKLKGSGDRVIGLEPLPAYPDTQCLRRPDGSRYFKVGAGPRKGEYGEGDVFFVRGFGSDPDCGLSVLSCARHSFGNALAAQELTGRYLANGVRPSLALIVDKILTEEQRAQMDANIIAPLSQSRTAGGVALLEAGMEVKHLAISPQEAQMLETMKFSVEDICRWFRVPPFMIGHTQTSTSWGTGLEQQKSGLNTFTLRPYSVRIVQAVNRQLIPAGERKLYTARVGMDDLLRGDSKSEAFYLSTLTRGGIMTRNEARAKLGLPPVEGGDELMVQQQDVPLTYAIDGAGNVAA